MPISSYFLWSFVSCRGLEKVARAPWAEVWTWICMISGLQLDLGYEKATGCGVGPCPSFHMYHVLAAGPWTSCANGNVLMKWRWPLLWHRCEGDLLVASFALCWPGWINPLSLISNGCGRSSLSLRDGSIIPNLHPACPGRACRLSHGGL